MFVAIYVMASNCWWGTAVCGGVIPNPYYAYIVFYCYTRRSEFLQFKAFNQVDDTVLLAMAFSDGGGGGGGGGLFHGFNINQKFAAIIPSYYKRDVGKVYALID
uniref:Uncharacterized protein n=1 Tax=Glossina austeni TaxID=7395 RepID=A0A1A9VB69_GLOAU